MVSIHIIGEKDSARPAVLEERQNFDNQRGEIAIDLLMETRDFTSNLSSKGLFPSISILIYHNTQPFKFHVLFISYT